jgi:hypothetical protein
VFGLKPDYAMVIDVNLASVPDVSKRETVDMDKDVADELLNSVVNWFNETGVNAISAVDLAALDLTDE